MIKLKEEMVVSQEALLEDKELERRVSLYHGLVERGMILTPLEMMLWWQLYSALQFAVRCLSNAAFHSLEKIAAVKDIRSFADNSSPVYKSYFQIWCI